MAEPITLPNTPTPSIVPAGVTVEGAPQPIVPQSTAAVEVPTKDHFGFLKEIDWLEAVIFIAAITGIIYAVNYYSTQIKTQKGAIATLNNEIADLQNKVQGLQQDKNSSTKNSGGDINRLF
jgi:hypothetical protein